MLLPDDLNDRCYVDGEIASKATGQEETVGKGNYWDMTVGYHKWKERRNFVGNLKDFLLYDMAMTQQEIEEWFNDDC